MHDSQMDEDSVNFFIALKKDWKKFPLDIKYMYVFIIWLAHKKCIYCLYLLKQPYNKLVRHIQNYKKQTITTKATV